MADPAPAVEIKHTAEDPYKEAKPSIAPKTNSEVLDDQAGKRGSTDHTDHKATHESESDLVEPTEEERRILRRVPDTLPLSAFSIALVELCERFSYFGLSGPFQNYLSRPLPISGNGAGAGAPGSGDPAGALGRKQAAATGLNNMFSFMAYIFPIIGAVIADTRWGRLKTIAVGCIFYQIGLIIVTTTSIPTSLARGGGLPGWIVGAIIVAMGTGGIKSNVSPLIADQYRITRPYVKTLPSGERVVVDPNLTIQRMYNMYYWCINVGSLSAIATTEIEFHLGFWPAFLLPTCVFTLTPLVLALSYKLYYIVPPRCSIVIETWQVVRIAIKGFWTHPIQYIQEVRHSDIWNRAKPSYVHHNEKQSDANPPRDLRITWDDAFVDEVKRTVRACKVFLFFPLYWICTNQVTTNLVSQAAGMSLHGVPNDLIFNFDAIILIISIPLMDLFIYPGLRRVGIVLRPIARITLGFMFGVLSMIYSAVLQHFIYRTNPCGDFVSTCDTPSSVNVWVQIPGYALIAISEIFASITGLEYAYNKAPARMKSVVTSVYLFMTAIGNAFGAALAPVGQDPKLVWNYTGVAITAFLAGIAFYSCFHNRDRREEDENAIGKGKREEQQVPDATGDMEKA